MSTWVPPGNAKRHAVDCTEAMGYYQRYPVPVAAALWCAVPPKDIQTVLDAATEVSRAVLRHPTIDCLEPKCRAIHEAIDAGALPVYREQGGVVHEHVAPERRHVSRDGLRDFIKSKRLDMPPTLFDEIERSAHPEVSLDAYQSLRAELEKERASLRQAEKWAHEIMAERDKLMLERDQARALLDKAVEPGQKKTKTYLNTIGALLKLMLAESPGNQKYSIFENQAAIISALLGHYSNKQGIAPRTLDQTFADAKRSLKSS